MSVASADAMDGVLRRVSRSFYLTIKVLPRDLRRPIGLAYLFARAADIISDSPMLKPADRLENLEIFRNAFKDSDPSLVRQVNEALADVQKASAERALLGQLEQCFAAYQAHDEGDRELVKRVVLTLTQGMVMDLNTFPGEDEGRLVALETRADLDRYTYYIAGCVGEFWTDIQMAHRPSMAGWDTQEMRQRGVRFGKGLQMTNILRDLARDLRIGRCYLPRDDLEALGIQPEELLDPGAIDLIRPLIRELIVLTLGHYKEGWAYTLAIPRREFRMRLACAWPLLIGLKTLALVERSKNLLQPNVTVKIPRSAVYRILLVSGALTWSNWGLDRYYQRIHRGLLVGS